MSDKDELKGMGDSLADFFSQQGFKVIDREDVSNAAPKDKKETKQGGDGSLFPDGWSFEGGKKNVAADKPMTDLKTDTAKDKTPAKKAPEKVKTDDAFIFAPIGEAAVTEEPVFEFAPAEEVSVPEKAVKPAPAASPVLVDANAVQTEKSGFEFAPIENEPKKAQSKEEDGFVFAPVAGAVQAAKEPAFAKPEINAEPAPMYPFQNAVCAPIKKRKGLIALGVIQLTAGLAYSVLGASIVNDMILNDPNSFVLSAGVAAAIFGGANGITAIALFAALISAGRRK